MFRSPPLVAALAAFLLATDAFAQIVPPGAALEMGASMTQPLATGRTGCRLQAFYPATDWTSQTINTAIELRSIQFRADGFTFGGYGCVHDVSVFLSTRAAAPGIGFGPNHGPDLINAFSGDLMLTPAVGAAPNSWILTIPVRPFVYDPSLGKALVVDLVLPHGCTHGFGVPVDAANVSQTLVGGPDAAAGTLVNTVPVLSIAHDVLPTTRARAERFGFGCSNRPTGLHEYFDANNPFDLSGSSIKFLSLLPGWNAVPGGAWINPTFHTPLVLGDDALSAGIALPFSFPLPPLLCTTWPCPNAPDHARFFRVESNGNIWFTSQDDIDPTPTPREFVRNGPRIAALWTDLDPSAGGNVTFAIVAGNPVITWLNVPMKGNVALTNSVQLELFPTGAYEVRYQAVLTTKPILVGFTIGGGSGDLWSQDLGLLPTVTQAGLQRLDLTAAATPIIGTAVPLDTCNIPWDDFPILVHAYDFAAPPPWNLGWPYEGCYWYLTGAPVFHVTFGYSCCYTMPLVIPNNASLVGIDVFAQTAAINGKPWSQGVTSNALHLRLGTF